MNGAWLGLVRSRRRSVSTSSTTCRCCSEASSQYASPMPTTSARTTTLVPNKLHDLPSHLLSKGDTRQGVTRSKFVNGSLNVSYVQVYPPRHSSAYERTVRGNAPRNAQKQVPASLPIGCQGRAGTSSPRAFPAPSWAGGRSRLRFGNVAVTCC